MYASNAEYASLNKSCSTKNRGFLNQMLWDDELDLPGETELTDDFY